VEWYDDIFRDPEMARIDPFGYGMGLALGYVIIPAVLLGLVLSLGYLAWVSRRQ
jgi:hypothetical protein